MNPLDDIDIASLALVKYPDPRLRAVSAPVEVFDDRLKALVERMFAVMYEKGGVGLAAAQVGVNLRIFVANPTLESGDERCYINPEIIACDGALDEEEGCLSFPNISCKVRRYARTTVRANRVDGESFEETGEGLLARIHQHEIDHLDGRLLVDRMSPVARIANRRTLKDLEEAFAGA